MSDRYLWDRSGEPDPEIARLEALLEPLRFDEPLAHRPAREVIAPSRLRWMPAIVAVAAALLLLVASWQRGAGRDQDAPIGPVVEYRPHFAGAGGCARALWVPGLICETRGARMGTPALHSASLALRVALGRFDFESGGDDALAVVLAEARAADAVTLWHLLGRASGSQRGRIHDRLADLMGVPSGVTRAAVIAGDAHALEGWRRLIERYHRANDP